MLKRFIGDKKFYQLILATAIPIIIQTAITNIVSLVDNVMVGKIGTLQMSGVAITNQLLNIYILAIFGSVNAAGLFLAQYAGKKDEQGIKNCFNLKIYISIIISIIFIFIFIFLGKPLISSYLDPKVNSSNDIIETLQYGWQYLLIMLVGLIPFALKESLSSTLRETSETVTPMIASSIAIFINVLLNYVLIFGHFGFKALGIQGAAIATVISRFGEFILVWILGFRLKYRLTYLQDPFKNLTITADLVKKVIIRGAPLAFNEVLWSASIAGINQCYSTRGLSAVAAITILTTVSQIYVIVCNSMGVSLSIIIGQILGTNDIEKAKDYNTKIIAFSTALSCVLAVIFVFLSPLFPKLYNTSEAIKQLATVLLIITAIKLPIQAIYMCCYFTMRSGGKTVVTFLFDSFFSTVICWPIAYIIANYTSISLVMMFILVNSIDIIKVILGLYLVKKGIWINVLVD